MGLGRNELNWMIPNWSQTFTSIKLKTNCSAIFVGIVGPMKNICVWPIPKYYELYERSMYCFCVVGGLRDFCWFFKILSSFFKSYSCHVVVVIIFHLLFAKQCPRSQRLRKVAWEAEHMQLLRSVMSCSLLVALGPVHTLVACLFAVVIICSCPRVGCPANLSRMLFSDVFCLLRWNSYWFGCFMVVTGQRAHISRDQRHKKMWWLPHKMLLRYVSVFIWGCPGDGSRETDSAGAFAVLPIGALSQCGGQRT